MRCPTVAVNINGHRVIINRSDYNCDIMAEWIDFIPDSTEITVDVVQAEDLVQISPPPPPPFIK